MAQQLVVIDIKKYKQARFLPSLLSTMLQTTEHKYECLALYIAFLQDNNVILDFSFFTRKHVNKF